MREHWENVVGVSIIAMLVGVMVALVANSDMWASSICHVTSRGETVDAIWCDIEWNGVLSCVVDSREIRYAAGSWDSVSCGH